VGCFRSTQSYLDRGNRYYAEGKYEDAALNYRNSIQRNPNLAEAHYRLALAERKQGAAVEAYNELRRAFALAPGRDDIRIELAEVALNGYQASPNKPRALYDEVVREADYLLKKDPSSFDGLRLRADLLTIDGKLDDAVTMYLKANTIRPMEASVVYPLIQVMFRLNRIGEGEDLAKRFIQRHKDMGTVYDTLAAQYIRDKRLAEAEQVLKLKIANMPKDAAARVQLASFYQQQQREPEMSQALRAILSDPKDFPEGHAIVGDFYASIQKPAEALREYNSGLSSSVKNKVLYEKRSAQVLIGQGKRDEAIEQLNQLLKVNPQDVDARTARAFLLRASNDPAKLTLAVAELNSLVEQDPKNELLRYNLGLAYWAKGDVKSARPQLMESAKLRRNYLPPRIALAEISQRSRDFADTIRLANEILAVDPRNSDGKLWRVAGLIGIKSYQPAQAELEALLREYPDSLNINLHMAVLEMIQKKNREAEARYLKFYKPGQNDLRPLEGLIQIYAQERQPDKAMKLLEEEVKQAPQSQPARLLLASTAVRAGKLDLAIQQYEWLRSNGSNSPQAYASLGTIYQLRGDVNSAMASYQKARELAPNDPKIIAAIAFLESTSGKEAQAIADLQKQLAVDPQNTVAMNNLAFALADTGTDLDRAQTLALDAQKKAPNNPGIADTLAWVYVKKGLNDSAIQIISSLVKKYPDEPALRYHLGVALLQKGEPGQARAEFVIGLSKNPPKDMAEKIKQILSTIG
jgi:tetratricopeptide (TPR) repeat protein